MSLAALILAVLPTLAVPVGDVTVSTPGLPTAVVVPRAPVLDRSLAPQVALSAGALMVLSGAAGAAAGAVGAPLLTYAWAHPRALLWRTFGERVAYATGRRAVTGSVGWRAWAVAQALETLAAAARRTGSAVVGVLGGLWGPQGAVLPPQVLLAALVPLLGLTVVSSTAWLDGGVGSAARAAGTLGHVAQAVAGQRE